MKYGFGILILLVAILPIIQIWVSWISYILLFLIAILSAFQIWWQHLLQHFFKDARTNDHKELRTRLLTLAFALLISNQFVNFLSNYQIKKEKENLASDVSSLSSNQTNLINGFTEQKKTLDSQITNLTSQISTVNSNQFNLSLQNRSLLDELATNEAISPNLREGIVESDKSFHELDSQVTNLNAWKVMLKGKLSDTLALQQIGRENDLKAAHIQYDKDCVFFEYTIAALEKLLEKAALSEEDTAASSYHGLPNFVTDDLGETNIAQIRFNSNSNWCFQVSMNANGVSSYRSIWNLTITCKGGLLTITPMNFAGQILTKFHVAGGEVIDTQKPDTDFKKAVDDGLSNLVAAELNAEEIRQSSQTNK